MSADEFQQLWKAYDLKLQKSLQLNAQLLEEVRSIKVKSTFNRLKAGRIFKICWGVVWNIGCGALLWHFRSEPVFVTCAALVMLITAIGIAGYSYQLAIIQRINFEKNILETQQELAQLEAAIIRTHRIMVLQTPLYTCFWLSRQMIEGMGVGAWAVQIFFTGLFIWGTIRIYRAFSLRNVGQRWMQSVMKNEGFSSIAQARAFLREIEEFRRDPAPDSI
ncbi:MAG TPA: hypothetical protein VNV35_01975 [Puia sp.]|jgi:hypothetical protein|nr:hypothetical protein [Puia sp.]